MQSAQRGLPQKKGAQSRSAPTEIFCTVTARATEVEDIQREEHSSVEIAERAALGRNKWVSSGLWQPW